MYLHSGSICNVSPGHLFCLFNRAAPVSLERILPPCSRYQPPRLKTLLPTQARGDICASVSLRSLPLKLGGLTRYWQGRVLSPGEKLWNPLRLNLAPRFILAFSLAALETNCYWLSLYCCRFFHLFVSLSASLSLFFLSALFQMAQWQGRLFVWR